MTAVVLKLLSGYYNSQPISGANPGGLAASGHATNFPAALVDLAQAVSEAASDATIAEAARVAAQAALTDIVAGLAGALLKADNLSGLQSVATARTNLQVGTGNNVSFRTVTVSEAPTAGGHLTTKDYVDNAMAGMRIKPAARVASTANVNVASAPASIDGVTLTSGDYVLLKNQSTASQNGLYVHNGSGSAMTRAPEMDSWAELPGSMVFVNEGTAGADRAFVCTSNAGGTLGSTAVAFSQFLGTGAFQAVNAILTALAGMSLSPDKLLYATGASAFSTTDLTAFARTLLDDADAASARATLGVTTTEAAQNIRNAPYTFALSDSGNHVYHDSASTHVWTIPANADVAFPIGSMITLINDGGNVTLTPGAGVALVQAGSGLTGGRTILPYGTPTLIKVGANRWFIAGAGVN